MSTPPLVVLSPSLRLRVLTRIAPFSFSDGDWRFTETLGEHRFHHYDEVYHPYQVRLERSIRPEEDPGNVYIEARYIALGLARAWVYVTGLPIVGRGYDLFLSPIALPAEWSSNATDVVPDSDWSILQSRLTTAPTHRTLPRLPLAAAVRFMELYREADPVVTRLCEHYNGALETIEPELHLLHFGHALEIVRELLPGTDKAEKQRLLPLGLTSLLRRPIDWLFDLANRRRETRHSIDKRTGLSLHPEMTEAEASDFEHDSDILIRYAICNKLGLPLVYEQGGISHEAA